jgi:hypothetical protein
MEAMTRRRILCGLLLASAVLACFAGWLWMASGPRPSSGMPTPTLTERIRRWLGL